MAYAHQGIDIPMIADVDLSGFQYHFVSPASTAAACILRVAIATGCCNPGPIGVLQNEPAAGDTATVRVAGMSKLVVNGNTCAIHTGRTLCVIAGSGIGIPARYTNLTASDTVHAVSLDYASGASMIVEVILRPWLNTAGYLDTGS